MKKNTYTEKDVRREAYRMVYSHGYLLMGKLPKRDNRLNFTHDVKQFIKKIDLTEQQVNDIIKLKQKRAKAKRGMNDFTNIYNEPLVKDYRNNKGNLRGVYDNRLFFSGGRNHWAKNDRDVKILAILKKNFMQRREQLLNK